MSASRQHLGRFLCANSPADQDGQHVINYTQRDSEDHYWAMRATPEAQVHMNQAATIATNVHPPALHCRLAPPQAVTGLP
ncbi:hypothetical protein ACMATS_14120 [Streptoverticillium reticulum]|uniref:hypothetical protein n=1 Tax=Streptoverticillium reticulum TaxID=1433415 RepID=UPI0039BF2C0D